jgi:hypothetical protein
MAAIRISLESKASREDLTQLVAELAERLDGAGVGSSDGPTEQA